MKDGVRQMRLGYAVGFAVVVAACLMSASCQIITEAVPGSAGPVDTPTPPPKTPTPKKKTPTPDATATTAPTATPTDTPAPVPTQSPETSCPATAPGVLTVNGGNHCAPYVHVNKGNCGIDSTWWYDCSDFYFVGAVYQYIGGGDPWLYVGQDKPTVACYVQGKNYKVGDLARICATGGATTCDLDHMQNPAMIACCHNHVWVGDDRRVVVSAKDASGTQLAVNRGVNDNPAFSEIVIAHPGQQLTVTYCLPPPPLVDGQCGTVFPYGSGCSTKVFTP
jgi:hypothetical protein